MIESIVNVLQNKKIAILGFGREGEATYKFIRKYIPDTYLDIIDESDVSNKDLFKEDNKVTFIYGKNYLDNLEKYDLVIKTPGITLKDIDTSNINITSELELLLMVARDRVIGVTGTKGKTTTSMLIYNILKENGLDVIVAGNMGIPVFSILDEITDNTLIVVEMSSHQLEYINISPHIGVVLNLFEDHLDHAGSIEHYYESKMHMFKYQNNDDYMVYCQDNKNLNDLIKSKNFKSKKITVDLNNEATVYLNNNEVYYNKQKVFDTDLKRNLKGMHNFENIMVAYAVSKILNLDDKLTLQAITNFKPVAYRLELVGVIDDVEYYVDTLATIPEATKNAIRAIDNISTLIFGGLDRGISYAGFADFLKNSQIENFICMPETGHVIAKELPKEKVYLVDTLEEACDIAKKVTRKHTACILSPAASSYNQFKNYAEKGDKFKEYINKNKMVEKK